MIRIGLKSLAARRLRTALTALAVVLGVAMVSAAFTITDTMRGAADSLSSAAYDGTDAVVQARTAFDVDAGDWTAERPTVDAGMLEKVRAVPGVAVAAADVTDEAKIIKRDGKPAGDGPYFGVGYDAHTPGTEQLTPFRLDSGRWATGPGEVVLDARHRGRPGLQGRRHRQHHHARRAAQVRGRRHRPLRLGQVARHRHVRGVRPRRGAQRCSAAATRSTASSWPAATACRRRSCARSSPKALPNAQVVTAARSGPLHARRPARSSSRSSGSCCWSSAAWRSWSARSRSSTRSRSPSPSARVSWGCCGWSAPAGGRCSARCSSRR